MWLLHAAGGCHGDFHYHYYYLRYYYYWWKDAIGRTEVIRKLCFVFSNTIYQAEAWTFNFTSGISPLNSADGFNSSLFKDNFNETSFEIKQIMRNRWKQMWHEFCSVQIWCLFHKTQMTRVSQANIWTEIKQKESACQWCRRYEALLRRTVLTLINGSSSERWFLMRKLLKQIWICQFPAPASVTKLRRETWKYPVNKAFYRVWLLHGFIVFKFPDNRIDFTDDKVTSFLSMIWWEYKWLFQTH